MGNVIELRPKKPIPVVEEDEEHITLYCDDGPRVYPISFFLDIVDSDEPIKLDDQEIRVIVAGWLELMGALPEEPSEES